jgi:acetyl-CoA C-acetyltransferase
MPVDLRHAVIRELLARTGIEPSAVDDVILGQCYPNGEAPAPGTLRP